MRKISLLFLAGFISLNTFPFPKAITSLGTYGKSALGYVASVGGLQDMGAAYALGMGITAAHELGHGLTAKFFYGCPLDITLGSIPRNNEEPIAQIGAFKLGGFNPATGVARMQVPANRIRPMEKNDYLRRIAILLAGPVTGGITGLIAYGLLSKYAPAFYIARLVALYAVLNHAVGPAGIGGLNSVGSDAHSIREAIRGYRNFK